MAIHRASRTLSTAAMATSTAPTLATVLAGVDADGTLSLRKRQDVSSALRTVGKVLKHPLAELPAHPSELRSRLKGFVPAQDGLSDRRWRNVLSLLRFALKHAGIARVPARYREPMSPSWTELLQPTQATDGERHGLSRLARYCTVRHVEPAGVDNALLGSFIKDLDASELTDNVATTHRRLATIWNRFLAKLPDGPCRPVDVPVDPRKFSFPWSRFPASLQDEVDAYFRRLSGGDELDECGVKPLRPDSIVVLRWRLLAFLSALVHLGRSPDKLTSLREAIAVETVKPALRFFLARSAERSAPRRTDQAHRIACCVLAIAKHWVKADQGHVKELQALCKRLHPGPSGMTTKNRARLRQFDDPANLSALLVLPQTLAAQVAQCKTPSRSDALKMQTAVAIEILLMVPIRRGNLARLDIHRHMIRTRGGVMHLVIPAEEVKNSSPVEAILPAETVRLIDTYLDRYRPLLFNAPSPWLFPGVGGHAKRPEGMTAQIGSSIRRHCGLQMNPHLFRHLAAKMYLDSHPGAYGVVRLVNGHKSVDTTTDFYCGAETTSAMRHYDAHVLELRRQAEAARLPRAKRNKPARRRAPRKR